MNKQKLPGLALFIMTAAAVMAFPQQPYTPPSASSQVLTGIDFTAAAPIDETYRAEFDRCDREDKFRDQAMNGFRKCTTDKNNAKALLKFTDGTVFFESKLSLDIDGSWKACHNAGSTDQCPTWFKWRDNGVAAANIDADKYPYIVIPIAGLSGANDRVFRDKTGLGKGDLGVVVYKDKVVPVFVADGGPHNKLGEGSTALLKAIGEDRCREWKDGHCLRVSDHSVESGVLFFLFPNSKPANLTAQNATERINTEALRRFRALRTGP